MLPPCGLRNAHLITLRAAPVYRRHVIYLFTSSLAPAQNCQHGPEEPGKSVPVSAAINTSSTEASPRATWREPAWGWAPPSGGLALVPGHAPAWSHPRPHGFPTPSCSLQPSARPPLSGLVSRSGFRRIGCCRGREDSSVVTRCIPWKEGGLSTRPPHVGGRGGRGVAEVRFQIPHSDGGDAAWRFLLWHRRFCTVLRVSLGGLFKMPAGQWLRGFLT